MKVKYIDSRGVKLIHDIIEENNKKKNTLIQTMKNLKKSKLNLNYKN